MNGSSMWEAPFVKTFQNKDNLFIKFIFKGFTNVQTKCRKMLLLSFVLSFYFSFKLAKIHIQRSFFIYPFIYLCFS